MPRETGGMPWNMFKCYVANNATGKAGRLCHRNGGDPIRLKNFWRRPLHMRDLDWHKYVEIDPQYCRPAEVNMLIGDATKAKRQLGWEPKIKFKELVRLMVDADIAAFRRGRKIGFKNVNREILKVSK